MTFKPKNAGEPVDARHSSHSWDTATPTGWENTAAPPLPQSSLLLRKSQASSKSCVRGPECGECWGRRGGEDKGPQVGEGSQPWGGLSCEDTRLPPRRAWIWEWEGTGLCVAFQCRSQKPANERKDSLRSQPRAGVVPGTPWCPLCQPHPTPACS